MRTASRSTRAARRRAAHGRLRLDPGHVFTPICTVSPCRRRCAAGLRLDAANSYNLLVGVAQRSRCRPSFESIQAIRTSATLIQKLEGHAAVGARMPFGGPYLSGADIAVIRQWITEGAQPASPARAPPAFTMAAARRAEDEVLSHPPPQIMIGFNRDLDVTRIHPGRVRIERRAGQGIDASVESVRRAPRCPPPILGVPCCCGRFNAWVRDAIASRCAPARPRA